MITIVLLMVRLRRYRALALALLAAFCVAVAVAAPAYLALADRAMIGSEVANASTAELSASAEISLDLSQGRDPNFEAHEPVKLAAPWWDVVFAADTDVLLSPTGSAADAAARQTVLGYRDGYCAHLVLASGRCPLSNREVLLDTATAADDHLGPGSAMSVFGLVPTKDGLKAVGPPLTVSVVGVYRVPDPTDRYWGTDSIFVTGVAGAVAPVLTERGTLLLLTTAATERQHVDASLRPGVLTPSMFPQVTAKLAGANGALGSGAQVTSQIPALLAAIEVDRRAVRQLVPLTAVPLVALGCFVLFLVCAQSVQERRGEIGVVRLRGPRLPVRWWLGVGESVVPAVVGVVVGLLAGGPLTRALAAATLPATAGSLTPTGRPAAALVAIVAVFVAVVLAHRRTLAESVVEVLRRVPPRGRAWRSAVAETVLLVLAAVTVAQLRLQPGPLTGLMLLTPALVIAAIAVLSARLAPPVAGWIGDRFLGVRSGRRKARLGIGLGALQLARRPGAQRLFAVQVVAIGLCGYAVIASSVATHARTVEVRDTLGAARVLTVDAVGAARLQAAVHAADPAGRYAMAVAQFTPGVPTDPPLLAVDSPRLARVAAWPGGAGRSAAAVARELRPAVPAPASLRATEIAVRIDTVATTRGVPLRLRMVLAPLDGAEPVTADLGTLALGEHRYAAKVPPCAAGCRVSSVTVDQAAGTAFAVTFVLEAVRTVAPVAADVPLGLTADAKWHAVDPSPASEPTTVLATSGGLSAALAVAEPGNAVGLAPIDVPYPLPVVSTTGALHGSLRGIGGQDQLVRVVATVAGLPRLGATGALVDLDYAASVADPGASLSAPEVWLTSDAPAAVIAALTAGGLHIRSDTLASAQTRYVNARGPAVGARINLAFALGGPLLAVACLLLMGGIDRRHRAAEFGALRVQGLAMATVRRAGMVGQLGLVIGATIVGALAGFIAWIVTGARVPLLTEAAGGRLTLPGWPVVIGPAVAVGILLTVAAAGTVLDTVRLTRRASG